MYLSRYLVGDSSKDTSSTVVIISCKLRAHTYRYHFCDDENLDIGCVSEFKRIVRKQSRNVEGVLCSHDGSLSV